MGRYPAILLIIACTVTVSGCHLLPKKKRQAPSQSKTKVTLQIGSVAAVNPQFQFVLLDIGSYPPPPAKSKITLVRNGESVGTVTVGSEQKRPFVAADYEKFQPEIGDTAMF